MKKNWIEELREISTTRDDSGLPVYHRMIECASQMIADGRIPDALHLPPDIQLAAEIGINHITWAKVLNELKRRGMVERSRHRGTFIRRPVRFAESGGIGDIIAVFMDDINPSHMNMKFMDTIQRQLADAGYRTMFLSAAESNEMQYSQVINTMRMPGCRGGIIWSLLDDRQTAEILKSRPSNWPLVFMDGNQKVDGKQQYDLIRYDVAAITEHIADKFLASGGSEFICMAYERHMGLSFLTMVKSLKCKLSAAGFPVKNLKVVRCDDAFSDIEPFLDRDSNSLFIAFAHKELGLIKKVMREKSFSETRLMPAIGFTATGISEQYSWSLPIRYYDTVDLASQGVQCLLRRIKNSNAAYEYILISGIADHCADVF